MTEPFLLLTRACLFLENQKVAPRELTFRCSCSCGEAASTQTCFRWHTQPSDACRNLQSKLADFNYDSAPTETQRQLFVAQTGINKGWDYRGSLSQLQLHYPVCLHVYGGEERLSLPPSHHHPHTGTLSLAETVITDYPITLKLRLHQKLLKNANVLQTQAQEGEKLDWNNAFYCYKIILWTKDGSEIKRNLIQSTIKQQKRRSGRNLGEPERSLAP